MQSKDLQFKNYCVTTPSPFTQTHTHNEFNSFYYIILSVVKIS